jgi:hypothetical protein
MSLALFTVSMLFYVGWVDITSEEENKYLA